MSGFERLFKKVSKPVTERYRRWDEGKFDRWNARYEREDMERENFILANRNNPEALMRAGIGPRPEQPPFHAKEYYECRGGRDDLFLEKVLYDKKKRRWL